MPLPTTAAYRRVLRTPGAVAFSIAGLMGRLPISMVGLGIVLLVSARTGSYAVAGGVSAAYVAANAVFAVPVARLVDRRGQAAILGVAASVSAAGLTGLVLLVEASASAPWPHLAAAAAGATMPNVGAAVRARWSFVLGSSADLDTAFALEAVNDELVFIVGPTLVTFLAAAVDPRAGLAAALAASLVGIWWLVSQTATDPPLRRSGTPSPGSDSGPMPWAVLAPLVVGAAGLGSLFGGCEVAVVAFADERDRPATAGVLLALWALGSLLSGLLAGGITYRTSAVTRYRRGVAALTALMAPLALVDSLWLLATLLFLAGFAISPTLIAAVSRLQAVVPAARLNEGMSLFSSSLVGGVAVGSALVGLLVDHAGAGAGFLVPAAGGATATVVAVVAMRERLGSARG